LLGKQLHMLEAPGHRLLGANLPVNRSLLREGLLERRNGHGQGVGCPLPGDYILQGLPRHVSTAHGDEDGHNDEEGVLSPRMHGASADEILSWPRITVQGV